MAVHLSNSHIVNEKFLFWLDTLHYLALAFDEKVDALDRLALLDNVFVRFVGWNVQVSDSFVHDVVEDRVLEKDVLKFMLNYSRFKRRTQQIHELATLPLTTKCILVNEDEFPHFILKNSW